MHINWILHITINFHEVGKLSRFHERTKKKEGSKGIKTTRSLRQFIICRRKRVISFLIAWINVINHKIIILALTINLHLEFTLCSRLSVFFFKGCFITIYLPTARVLERMYLRKASWRCLWEFLKEMAALRKGSEDANNQLFCVIAAADRSHRWPRKRKLASTLATTQCLHIHIYIIFWHLWFSFCGRFCRILRKILETATARRIFNLLEAFPYTNRLEKRRN